MNSDQVSNSIRWLWIFVWAIIVGLALTAMVGLNYEKQLKRQQHALDQQAQVDSKMLNIINSSIVAQQQNQVFQQTLFLTLAKMSPAFTSNFFNVMTNR